MCRAAVQVVGCTLLCAAVLPAAAQVPARIEVYTIAGIPVTQVPDGAVVTELDQAARLDQRLSRGLPADAAAAITAVKARIARFRQTYGEAYTGLLRAWRSGVEQVPAVVVDGVYVVYGQPNVARALALIREARAEEAKP